MLQIKYFTFAMPNSTHMYAHVTQNNNYENFLEYSHPIQKIINELSKMVN